MMIFQLADPANAITAIGLAFSIIAINFSMSGRPEIGVAIALWALLADHLDGVVAARTKGRAPETGKVGKNLDSLADLVSAAVFPAVTLISVSAGSLYSVIAGLLLVICSALRLSYFNVFGLDGDRFIGVPTTYALPLTAVIFLIRPLLSGPKFPLCLSLGLIALAALHISSVRVPRTKGIMYAVVTIFCVASSVLLATREMVQ